MNSSLYEGKNFTSWTVARIAEVICEELQDLGPTLEKNAVVYDKKATLITFSGEVTVALELANQRFPDKDVAQIYVGLSLSPKPYSLDTHVLNTLDMGALLGAFPELDGKHFFAIRKQEPWGGSLLAKAVRAMHSLVQAMLTFESCFHLLLDDEYTLKGERLDMKRLSFTHHLYQVTAYRLAEIYGHPEKLDEAAAAITRFAAGHRLSADRLEDLRAKEPKDAADWLYTPELLERLRS